MKPLLKGCFRAFCISLFIAVLAAIPVSGISYLMLQGEAGSRGTLAVGG